MEIPSYDRGQDANTNFKQLFPFIPSSPFRMLIAGPSGGGKTNLLVHMLRVPLLYYDKIFIYGRNLEQEKYSDLRGVFGKISKAVGYPVLECSSDIVPLSALDREAQKIVVFDDFVTEKNQGPLIEYFTGGRHKNYSCIYLSQSFVGTPKTIRLNCSHFCITEFPSKREDAPS